MVDLTAVDKIIEGYHGDKTAILAILQDIQAVYNYPARP